MLDFVSRIFKRRKYRVEAAYREHLREMGQREDERRERNESGTLPRLIKGTSIRSPLKLNLVFTAIPKHAVDTEDEQNLFSTRPHRSFIEEPEPAYPFFENIGLGASGVPCSDEIRLEFYDEDEVGEIPRTGGSSPTSYQSASADFSPNSSRCFSPNSQSSVFESSRFGVDNLTSTPLPKSFSRTEPSRRSIKRRPSCKVVLRDPLRFGEHERVNVSSLTTRLSQMAPGVMRSVPEMHACASPLKSVSSPLELVKRDSKLYRSVPLPQKREEGDVQETMEWCTHCRDWCRKRRPEDSDSKWSGDDLII